MRPKKRRKREGVSFDNMCNSSVSYLSQVRLPGI